MLMNVKVICGLQSLSILHDWFIASNQAYVLLSLERIDKFILRLFYTFCESDYNDFTKNVREGGIKQQHLLAYSIRRLCSNCQEYLKLFP